MALLRSAALFSMLACCPPDDMPPCPPVEMPADVQVVDKIEVSLTNGSKAPAELTGCAMDGLTLTMKYQPAELDAELFEHELLDSAEWEIVATVTDADGNPTRCSYDGNRSEFYDYEWMGWMTEGDLWRNASKVHWISPDPPELQDASWQHRWGRIELPEEVGEYDLTIAIHPAPEIVIWERFKPGDRIPIPDLGPGFVIFEAKVTVDVETESHIGRSGYAVSLVTPETRGFILQELERIGTE